MPVVLWGDGQVGHLRSASPLMPFDEPMWDRAMVDRSQLPLPDPIAMKRERSDDVRADPKEKRHRAAASSGEAVGQWNGQPGSRMSVALLDHHTGGTSGAASRRSSTGAPQAAPQLHGNLTGRSYSFTRAVVAPGGVLVNEDGFVLQPAQQTGFFTLYELTQFTYDEVCGR